MSLLLAACETIFQSVLSLDVFHITYIYQSYESLVTWIDGNTGGGSMNDPLGNGRRMKQV